MMKVIGYQVNQNKAKILGSEFFTMVLLEDQDFRDGTLCHWEKRSFSVIISLSSSGSRSLRKIFRESGMT